MSYGIANIAAIPLRGEPSHRSEMVSQLLFGDAYSVVETTPEWMLVRTCDCGYEGWMDCRLHNPLSENDLEKYLGIDKYVVRDIVFFVKNLETNIAFPVFIGSSFPYPKDGVVKMGNSSFKVEIPDETPVNPVPGASQQQARLLQFVKQYLQAPYLWGGRTPAGIDCSGFAQIAYKSLGISLPRDASQQVQCGSVVGFVDEAAIGDLAFFENEAGNITHVGIVCGARKIIHASAKVKIDTLDSTGIFSEEQKKYTHPLRVIKRILV